MTTNTTFPVTHVACDCGRIDFDQLSGSQTVNVGGAVVGTDATGLSASTQGYQTVNVGGAVVGTDATGLANDATVYTASVAVDGTSNPVSVTGSAVQTYTDLLSVIGPQLSGATVALTGGNLEFTSSSTGASSTIAITDTDLFSSLTAFVAILAAVDGVDAPTYTASVAVDGTANPISVSGDVAQTYSALISAVGSQLTGATIALTGGNIVITSSSVGSTSTIAITDTDLFSSLTAFAAILAANAGGDAVESATNMLNAITTLVTGDFTGWSTFDTFGTTAVFKKTISTVDRYVSVELDSSGTKRFINVKAFTGWDAGTHTHSQELNM